MKCFSFLILVGFLGMTSLAFMPMNHSAHHGASPHTPCPIAVVLDVICNSDAVSMAVAHISALQSLFGASISLRAVITSALLAAMMLLFVVFKVEVEGAPPVFGKRHLKTTRSYISPVERERAWLSLFELSPSFA